MHGVGGSREACVGGCGGAVEAVRGPCLRRSLPFLLLTLALTARRAAFASGSDVEGLVSDVGRYALWSHRAQTLRLVSASEETPVELLPRGSDVLTVAALQRLPEVVDSQGREAVWVSASSWIARRVLPFVHLHTPLHTQTPPVTPRPGSFSPIHPLRSALHQPTVYH
jgi:hypothetical protein